MLDFIQKQELVEMRLSFVSFPLTLTVLVIFWDQETEYYSVIKDSQVLAEGGHFWP